MSPYSYYRLLFFIKKINISFRKNKKGTYFAFHHCPWARVNVFHWCTEVLPRLIINLEYNKKNEVYYTIPIEMQEYQKLLIFSLFNYYKIKSTNIVMISKYAVWKAERIQFIPFCTDDMNSFMHPDIASLCRDKVIRCLNLIPNKNPKLHIYVSRSLAKKRRILNEEHVIKTLQEYNFIILNAENLSYLDQISYFNNSFIIIGCHGAGLTNVMFSNNKSKLIEFHPAGYPRSHYMLLSKSKDIDYYPLFGSDSNKNEDFHVDISSLEKLLSEIAK